MLAVLTETYCNKVNIQITQRDDFIQIVNLNYTSKLSPHRAVNTRRLAYKIQPVNAVCRNHHCLFRKPQET